jgi:uncharacterized membrane protein YeaQ/YmgE (transglycosylase-associated protein family)
MTDRGFIVLLILAFGIGGIGHGIGAIRIPGGWAGSVVVAFLGAWLGGALVPVGPGYGGVQVVPALIGSVIVLLLARLIFSATRRASA